ncbi:hypothetical protein Hypma_001101 [Hypsizygus marmoreus]|uniref:Uncharacterized protein n=1 Tax=Hypsizygus marmoreus TaxID=39966 RepID=A0A369JAG0_HYPMA|nr:hypothetical protein Hypma_001101 [Hypsizygus marmoreus]
MDPHKQLCSTALNPIPRNTVAYLGGINADTRMYMLPEEFSGEESGRQFYFDLECIQNLLPTLEFRKTKWGYLVKSVQGTGYRYDVIQKPRRPRTFRCPLWAPLIEEKARTFTKFWDVTDRGGYWKGREVEVVLGYDDFHGKILEAITLAYWALQGLDITYEVLGHLVEEDGSVVGLVTEPTTGRLVQYHDRALVYDAFSKLQRRGLHYNGIEFYNIHILNGKMRLSNNIPSLRYHDDREEFERKSARMWEALNELFANLKKFEDNVPRPNFRQLWIATPRLLFDHPAPDRPLLLWITLHPPDDEEQRRYKGPGSPQKRGRARKYIASLVPVELSATTSQQAHYTGLSPHRMKYLRCRRSTADATWFEPRRQQPSSRRLLVGPADQASTD